MKSRAVAEEDNALLRVSSKYRLAVSSKIDDFRLDKFRQTKSRSNTKKNLANTLKDDKSVPSVLEVHKSRFIDKSSDLFDAFVSSDVEDNEFEEFLTAQDVKEQEFMDVKDDVLPHQSVVVPVLKLKQTAAELKGIENKKKEFRSVLKELKVKKTVQNKIVSSKLKTEIKDVQHVDAATIDESQKKLNKSILKSSAPAKTKRGTSGVDPKKVKKDVKKLAKQIEKDSIAAFKREREAKLARKNTLKGTSVKLEGLFPVVINSWGTGSVGLYKQFDDEVEVQAEGLYEDVYNKAPSQYYSDSDDDDEDNERIVKFGWLYTFMHKLGLPEDARYVIISVLKQVEPGVKYMIKHVGKYVAYIYALCRCRGFGDFLAATTLFCQTLPEGVVESALKSCSKTLLKYKRKIYEHAKGIPVNTEGMSDKLAEVRFLFSTFVNSDIIKVIQKLLLSIASYHWFSKEVADGIYKTLGKPKKMTIIEMIEEGLDSLQMLARYGDMWKDGSSMSEIFKSNDPTLTCAQRINELLFYNERTYSGLKVEGKKCISEYMMEARELIDMGNLILKTARPLDNSTIILKKVVSTLSISLADKVQIRNAHNRCTPMAVCLYGLPGIGKSIILDHICRLHCHAKGRVFKKGMIFTKSNTSQYNEGYDSLSHSIIHCSEVGNKTDELLKTQGDPIICDICSIIDSLPYCADMAFKEKGNVFYAPELVIIDTNNPELGLSKLVRNPAAVQRRFVYIRAEVKDKYKRLNSQMIDSAKSLADVESDRLDRWIFDVETREANGLVDVHVNPLLKGGDIYALSNLLVDMFSRHIDTQDQILVEHEEIDISKYVSCKQEQALAEMLSKRKLKSVEVQSEGAVNSRAQLNVYKVSWQSKLGALWPQLWMMFLSTLMLFQYSVGVVVAICAQPKEPVLSIFEVLTYFFISYFFMKIDRVFIFIPVLCGVLLYARTHEFFGVFLVYEARKRAILQWKAKLDDLTYLAGIKKEYPILASRWFRENSFALLGATAVFVLCIKLFRSLGKSEEVVPLAVAATTVVPAFTPAEIIKVETALVVPEVVEVESHTVCNNPTIALGRFNAFEEKLECAPSIVRHKINQSELWNSQFTNLEPAKHKGTMQSLSNVFAENVLKVKCWHGERNICVHLFGLCENFALINTHALGGVGTILDVSKNGSWDDKVDTVRYKTELSESNYVDLGNDLSLVRLGNLRFRDITMHLSDDFDCPQGKAGLFSEKTVRAHRKFDVDFLSVNGGEFKMYRYWQYDYPPHLEGDCGKPLIVQKNSGCCVVGLHFAGKPQGTTAYSTIVDKSSVMEALLKLKSKISVTNVTSESWRLPNLVNPIRKSPIFYEVLHGVKYLGKLEKPVLANQESRLIATHSCEKYKSLFKDKLNFVPNIEYGPPLMKSTYVDGKYVSPWNNGLKKMSKQKGYLSDVILQKVSDVLVEHIVSQLKERGIDKLDPLTLDDAINGAEGDDFISRINASTSGGFGYPGVKSKYIPIDPTNVDRVQRVATDELLQDISNRVDSYAEGKGVGVIHTAQLKDEPREKSKIKAGKTRIFYPSPLDTLILSRMLLAPLYSTMVQHCDIYGGAIGINMHSDADSLVKRLKAFSDKYLNGDYGWFDQGIPVEIHMTANDVILRVCAQLGYNGFSQNQLFHLLNDLIFPLVDILTDVFVVDGLTVSGAYGTAERNTLLNLILMMYFWYSMPQTREYDFFTYVFPANYGDDLLTSIKEKFSHVFNNVVYQRFVEEIYLMEYTSANKVDKLEKWDSLDSLSFLKRKFVYRDDIGMYVAQLDLNSILKSLLWYIPSPFVTREEQMLSTVASALWELAIHLDEGSFNAMRSGMSKILDDEFNIVSGPSLPTFEHIVSVIRRDEA